MFSLILQNMIKFDYKYIVFFSVDNSFIISKSNLIQ